MTNISSEIRSIRNFILGRNHDTEQAFALPSLPTNTLKWIEQARPMIGGTARRFDLAPFWIDVYEDNHPNKVIVNGRQTFKSTYGTDRIAAFATSNSNKEVTYVLDREDRARAWSKQRLRRDTFLANPILRQFLEYSYRANVEDISLRNNSVIYVRTDEGEYGRVEGLTNWLLLLDECQYQDLQFITKATYSLSQTKGHLECLGVGGEAGSEWHKMWTKSDQREWIYDNPNWRDLLLFDSEGNISNSKDELKAALAGRWVATRPENFEYRGYHMPQTIFPTIPLTIEDAITKYQARPQNSIEYQEKNFPRSIYLSHCLGQFYKAERRPITPEMVQACFVPYLSLMKAEEVRYLKDTFKDQVRVLMGVDYGSGPAASSTVAAILLHWRKSGRYQIAHIEKRPQEHLLDQSGYLAGLGKSFGIDHGVGDLGYGAIQVKLMQDGGTDSRGNAFGGLGKKKFQGCRTIGDETKPEMTYRQETDEHGTEVGRYQIDKTTTIQGFIDTVGTYISHPTNRDDRYRRTKLMIPSMNDWETDWLIDDFCSITRKDLEKDPDVAKEDPRQRARKEFNHPPDSVMSIIYCFVADQRYKGESAYRLFRV